MIDVIGVLLARVTDVRAAFLDAALSTRAPASTALSTADFTAGRATNLDAAVSGRATSIKSIQYGSITLPNSATSGSATATITSVTTSKAVVFWLGQDMGAAGSNTSNQVADVTLTNATTVTAASSYCNAAVISFVVVEFN